MAKLTCLVCLQKYPKDDNLFSPYQPRLLSSPPSSTPDENLYTRFLHLCTRHLKLNLATIPLINGRRDSSAFCPKCTCLVSYLCDLYHELEVVKLHLHWKLEELGKEIKWGLNSKQSHASQKALSEQLNVSTIRGIKYFRTAMKQAATRKNVFTPKLVIVRGLIPEMWKFPYSETRSTLARLIFLFALASKKLCSKPEVKAVFKEECEGGYHPQDSDYECGGDFAGFQSDKTDSDWSNPLSPCQSDEDFKPPKQLGSKKIRRKRKLLRNETGPVTKKRKTSKKINSALIKLDCPECPRKFIQHSRLANHLEHCHNDVSCPKCEEKFPVGSLKSHLVEVHNQIIMIHDNCCPICYTRGGNELQIIKHMSTHNINSDKDNPCRVCGKWFENELILLEHFGQLHQGMFCCLQPKCDAKYETPAELSTHLQSHEGPEKPFQCYFCSRNFTTEQFLRIHMTGHDNNLLICDNLECSKQFENVSELNDYLKSHLEPGKEIFYCSECNWGFLSNTDLLLHQLQHTPYSNIDNGGYNCPKCLLQFKFIPTLRSHFYNHHIDNDSSPLKCSICEYTTLSPTYFKLHNIAHAKVQAISSLANLKCGNCGKEFIDKLALKVHKQINHNHPSGTRTVPLQSAPRPARRRDIPNSTCKICSEDLETLTKLEKHMVTMHENLNATSHQCWFCSKRFSLPETLLVHRWSEHIRTQVFRCDGAKCNEFFYCLDEHEEHLRSHLEDAPAGSSLTLSIHQCPKCNLGFLHSPLMQYHELAHLERQISPTSIEGDFACPKCDQFYAEKHFLRTHYREAHLDSHTILKKISAIKLHRQDTEKKHLTCSNCTFSTKTKNSLRRHMRRRHPGTTHTCHVCNLVLQSRRAKLTHLKEQHKIQTKEYPCQVCGSSYVLPSSLKNHMRNVHGESRYVCDVCGEAFKVKIQLINHKDRHHNPNRTKEHICATCGKAYLTLNGLSLHMKSVHASEEEKRFGCPYCPKRYHRELLAKMHVKTCMKQRGLEVPDDLDEIEVEWSAAAIAQVVKYGRTGRRKLRGSNRL